MRRPKHYSPIPLESANARSAHGIRGRLKPGRMRASCKCSRGKPRKPNRPSAAPTTASTKPGFGQVATIHLRLFAGPCSRPRETFRRGRTTPRLRLRRLAEAGSSDDRTCQTRHPTSRPMALRALHRRSANPISPPPSGLAVPPGKSEIGVAAGPASQAIQYG